MEFWSVLTNVDNLTNLLHHTSPNDGIGKNSEACKHFISPFQLWKKTFHQRSEVIFNSWTEAERHESPLEWLRRSRRRQGEGMKFFVCMEVGIHGPAMRKCSPSGTAKDAEVEVEARTAIRRCPHWQFVFLPTPGTVTQTDIRWKHWIY